MEPLRRNAAGAAGAAADAASDMALVRRALAQDAGAFRAIMQAHNRKLYRIARSIVRDDAEAEDIVQEAYVRAFTSLATFRGEAALGTWLSRIVMNEALGRLRRRRASPVEDLPDALHRLEAQIIPFPLASGGEDPERTMAQREILRLVERATDALPDVYRTIFVSRVIEGRSTGETAELLGVNPKTVKTRLHRARALLREQLDRQIGPVLLDAFPFAGRRCRRMSDAVIARLGLAE
jgi:RNA polymerase sigma-70 factor (ECF subfamily)